MVWELGNPLENKSNSIGAVATSSSLERRKAREVMASMVRTNFSVRGAGCGLHLLRRPLFRSGCIRGSALGRKDEKMTNMAQGEHEKGQ